MGHFLQLPSLYSFASPARKGRDQKKSLIITAVSWVGICGLIWPSVWYLLIFCGEKQTCTMGLIRFAVAM